MKIEKLKKVLSNLHDKEEYVKRTRNLKQISNYGLVLEKVRNVHRTKKLG